jgi:hypothetical protein
MSQALLLIFVLATGFSLGWLLRAYLAWMHTRDAGGAVSGEAAKRSSDSN